MSATLAMTRFIRILLLTLLTLSASCVADPMERLVFIASLKAVRDNPVAVIEEVKRQPQNEQNPEQLAVNELLLSRAYSALVLNQKALEHANAGLAAISPTNKPYLYHFLALAKAQAQGGLGNTKAAIADAKAALKWADENHKPTLLLYALSVNGYLRISLNEYDDALLLFQRGYRLAEAQKNSVYSHQDFAAMIGLLHEYNREFEKSNTFYREAEEYYRKNNMQLELANTLFGLGKNLIQLEQRDNGLSYLLESANIALEIQDVQGAAFSYESLATFLIQEGRFTDASEFLDDALSLFKQAVNPYMQIKVLVEQARLAILTNEPQKAFALLEQAEQLAVGDSFLAQRISITDVKANALAIQGNYEAAYQLLRANRENISRQQQVANGEHIAELQMQFDLERQNVQNALLKEQNLRQQTQIDNEEVTQQYTSIVIFLLTLVTILLSWLYINGKIHQKKFEKLANRDVLTKLLSRRKTMEDLEQQFNLARRHHEPISVATLDLDHFKRINDTFGHQTGDDVLEIFGDIANHCFRCTDILGRVGGEEFLFVFPHTSIEDAKGMLEQFSVKVKAIPAALNQDDLSVSISIGLVEGLRYSSTDEVIAKSDEALYSAKNAGRDCLVTAPAK